MQQEVETFSLCVRQEEKTDHLGHNSSILLLKYCITLLQPHRAGFFSPQIQSSWDCSQYVYVKCEYSERIWKTRHELQLSYYLALNLSKYIHLLELNTQLVADSSVKFPFPGILRRGGGTRPCAATPLQHLFQHKHRRAHWAGSTHHSTGEKIHQKEDPRTSHACIIYIVNLINNGE